MEEADKTAAWVVHVHILYSRGNFKFEIVMAVNVKISVSYREHKGNAVA
jgi:hypothetical protein